MTPLKSFGSRRNYHYFHKKTCNLSYLIVGGFGNASQINRNEYMLCGPGSVPLDDTCGKLSRNSYSQLYLSRRQYFSLHILRRSCGGSCVPRRAKVVNVQVAVRQVKQGIETTLGSVQAHLCTHVNMLICKRLEAF